MEKIFLEKISKYVNKEEIINLISDLVKIPSYPGVKNQETKVAEYIYNLFKKEGIAAKLIHVEDGRKNIVAALKGSGQGKNLLLTGHLDTVPPYDMEDAFNVKKQGNKLIGRGTNDMKGPLACMIMAMIAIKKANIELKGDLIFAGVIDEEEKSLGTIDLIEKGIQADGAIVGEPSNLDICIAHRGLEWFEFDFIGKTVHGGKQKDGINAIVKASNFIQSMQEKVIPQLKKRIHPVTGTSSMNYGTITGGTQPSTVAGNCSLKIDRRWIPGEKYEDILNEYKSVIKELEDNDEGFKCNMKVMDVSVMKEGYIHEAMEINPNHQLVETIVQSSETYYGKTPKKTFFPAWSDGGLLNMYAHIPTLVFAPGDLETAHSKDEYIDVEQLLPAVNIYALTAYTFCNN